jgi:predicted ATPase/class 3 adenylate cyclase
MDRALPSGTVTLLFSDIEGSTNLLSRLGDRYADALSGQRAILRAAFRQWHGREMGTEGDSFFVVFESAGDAVAAALEGQRELARFDWPGGMPVRVRMGLHTGEPTVHEDGYVGLDVHRAARLSAAAHGGQVVLSDATRQLVLGHLPAGASLADLGWHRFKDITEPEHVFQLVADGLAADFPPLKSLGTQTNLPQTATSLVGRDGELAEIRELLTSRQARLVTLTGPGGSGKTRLAIGAAAELGASFADGVYFVPLAAVRATEVMWTAIAEALGVTGEGRAPPTFFEHVTATEALLVLDNLEHLPDAASVVSQLLEAGPRLRILATTRRVLHVAGEYEHPVPPLELPDGSAPAGSDVGDFGAVALFVQRAQMVQPSFRLSDSNRADVVSVCRALDGLPLAIELAAARSKLLTPRALAARLDQSLELAGTEVGRPERQQTLRNTIAWSYDLLTSRQQSFFRQLGVFSGGAELDAVAAVVSDERDVLEQVAELVDASLVTIREGIEGEPRVGLLQTIAAFACEQMPEAELTTARRRHAEHYLCLVEELAPQLRSPQFLSAKDRIENELDNLREALDWCLQTPSSRADTAELLDLGLRICRALSWFWYACGYSAEGRRWLERAVRLASDRESPELMSALHGLGVLLLQHGENSPACEALRRCLDYWRRQNDASRIAMELNSLAVAHRALNDVDSARSMLEESIGLARQTGDRRRLANVLSTLGVLEVDCDAPERAVELLTQAVEVDRELGDAWGEAVDEVNLVAANLRAGRTQAAHDRLCEVAADAIGLGDIDLTINVIELFAAVFGELADAARAARMLGSSAALREQAELPIPAPDAAFLERSTDPLRRTVDPAQWRGEMELGRSLSAQDALAEALGVRPER